VFDYGYTVYAFDTMNVLFCYSSFVEMRLIYGAGICVVMAQGKAEMFETKVGWYCAAGCTMPKHVMLHRNALLTPRCLRIAMAVEVRRRTRLCRTRVRRNEVR